MELTFRQTCLRDLKNVSPAERCLIIGEVAQSHDGSLGQAHAFIDAIADAGADAVKFQTHIAAAESTRNEPWRVKFSTQDETRYDYWERMEFREKHWAELKEHALSRNLLFISTPFSSEAFEMLNRIGMSVWKVASGEVGNLQLLDRMASTGAPMILSSGMSGWAELDKAVETVRKNGNAVAVLQCTSNYPCPPEKTGLNVLQDIQSRYQCPAGLSDHSGKIFAGLAAAALGAEVLEVHVTFNRKMFGPDVPSSIDLDELQVLVNGVRDIEKMMASPVEKDILAEELEPLRKIFTKSIYAAADLQAGTVLSQDNLRLKKPGSGLPAAELPNLVGKRLVRDLGRDEILTANDIDAFEQAV